MWPFTRKPKPINPGPINEDWRVGDLAESLYERWENEQGFRFDMVKGDTFKVLSVEASDSAWGPMWKLELGGHPNRRFNALGFRKVPPLNSKASAEFTAKIKALRPAPLKTEVEGV